MKKLRVGTLGAGQWALNGHLPGYRALGDKVEIAAVCDINKETAMATAAAFGITAVYGSHTEMLAKENLDAVSVCVTNRFHHPVTLDALRAGCHVLCEKPPAMNAADAREMYLAAKETGKILSYNFRFRHDAKVKAMREMADEGAFGRIYAATATAIRRRGIPGWGSFTNRETQGGGPLIDIGIHMLDTALYLMDYPKPVYVAAGMADYIGTRGGIGLMGDWDPKAFTVEDGLFGFIYFENGATLRVDTAFALNCREERRMNVELFGEFAGASVYDGEIYTEKAGALWDMRIPHLPKSDPQMAGIADFVDACANGREPVCTARQGLVVQILVDALYESARTGRPVELKENLFAGL